MIPDEAVEAAGEAIRDLWDSADPVTPEMEAKAALEAAAPHLMAEAFAYGWREGKGWPTPVNADTRELLHDEAKQPDWNPYKQEVEK